MTATASRTHHRKAHWQNLVDRQKHSGLSGAEFCRQENVRYASFMGWRKRFQGSKEQPSSTAPAAFVELIAPAKETQITQGGTESDTDLCVELSLGAGIELRITRRS